LNKNKMKSSRKSSRKLSKNRMKRSMKLHKKVKGGAQNRNFGGPLVDVPVTTGAATTAAVAAPVVAAPAAAGGGNIEGEVDDELGGQTVGSGEDAQATQLSDLEQDQLQQRNQGRTVMFRDPLFAKRMKDKLGSAKTKKFFQLQHRCQICGANIFQIKETTLNTRAPDSKYAHLRTNPGESLFDTSGNSPTENEPIEGASGVVNEIKGKLYNPMLFREKLGRVASPLKTVASTLSPWIPGKEDVFGTKYNILTCHLCGYSIWIQGLLNRFLTITGGRDLRGQDKGRWKEYEQMEADLIDAGTAASVAETEARRQRVAAEGDLEAIGNVGNYD
jgi:hypothetical protein